MTHLVRFGSGLAIVMDGGLMDRDSFLRALQQQRRILAEATAQVIANGAAASIARISVGAAALKLPLRNVHEIEAELARLLMLPDVMRDTRLHAEIGRLQRDVQQLRAEYEALQARLSVPGAPS